MAQTTTGTTFQFDGDAGSYLGTNILAALLTAVTIGIAAPWAVCMREQWKAQHTMIERRRCKFVGTGADLFGQWIIWCLLTVVTLGIYSLWVGPKLLKWRVEHTTFEG
jgi:uncharacterized membrane protein YjgN (DUF898 family)